jgi:hypothetical protein
MDIFLNYFSNLFGIVTRVILSDSCVGAIFLFVSPWLWIVLLDSIVGKLTAWRCFPLVDGNVLLLAKANPRFWFVSMLLRQFGFSLSEGNSFIQLLLILVWYNSCGFLFSGCSAWSFIIYLYLLHPIYTLFLGVGEVYIWRTLLLPRSSIFYLR